MDDPGMIPRIDAVLRRNIERNVWEWIKIASETGTNELILRETLKSACIAILEINQDIKRLESDLCRLMEEVINGKKK